ncbi:ABC transporter ATP-binding protein [Pedobacter sp. AW31-3R]|uniref:ABC transporter ATP-binding protein n=1 Tax=Pedobacter sp. AW31-3R TaxID=3445781 RepID=UPI003FA10884
MLHFNKFRKSYGHQTILSIDDLIIQTGIYWIKGVNGSGKSTLLKSVGGFLFFNGEILLDKISLKKNGVSYRRKVNFADAEPVYPEFLTGWELIKMFRDAKGGRAHQEDYFIESMNMKEYLSHPLGTYSSGMLKKLSLVLAFLGKPRLILLDEPLITIDENSLNTLYEWIRKKNKEDNITFFLSSHQPLDTHMLSGLREISVQQQTLTLEF